MGCISSKILTKSLSFREDLSQRSKRNRIANGIPLLDELFTSGNGTSGDHKFLGKSQIGSFNSPPKPDFEPTNVEMIDTWELMAGLEEQVEQKQGAAMNLPAQELVSSKIADVDKIRRSKSCHWSLENEGYIIDHAFEGLNVDQFGCGNKGVGRSRSFHTVEEYGAAMLERIQLSKGQNDDYVQLKPCGASTENYQQTEEHNRTDVEDPAQLFSRDKHSVEDNNAITLNSGPDIKEMTPSNNNAIEELSSFKDAGIQERSTRDTGLKRKAMAKGLESLQIPSAVELQSIGSLREWLRVGGDCVESPGHYVTPKFGNYNKFRSEFQEEWKEESIFDPELLAAFEEFIQQLEIEEEERILTNIEGNPDKITANDISAEENKEHLLDDRNSPQSIF